MERESTLLEITGLTPRQIAQLAMENHILVTELTPIAVTLEDAYLNLTQSEVEYRSGEPALGSDQTARTPEGN